VEAADEGWRLVDRQPAWRSIHLLAMARSRAALALGQPAKAVEACEAEVSRQAPTADGLFVLGIARELLASAAGPGERDALLEASAAAYRSALARAGAVEMVQLFDGAASFRSRSQLGGVLVRLGRLDEAEKAFAAALRERPGFDEARIGLAEVSLERGRPVEALQALERLLPSERPDAWTLAAAAAGELGGAADRGLLLQRAAERLPKGFIAPHRRERLRRLAEDQRGAATGDPAALLAALVERRPLPAAAVGAQPDDRLLQALASGFLARGHGDRLVPLLEPGAEAACPGLPGRFREVLRGLGAEVVGEAETAASAP
jgi:tetratricopeptide (TPR) repeat protein